MFEHQVSGSHAGVLARAHAVLDELNALELGSAADGEVLALWREIEPLRRKLAVIDHAVISEIEARRLGVATGARSTLNLARQLLRIGAGEAKARVTAAAALGPRRALTGEPLAPIYAVTAAAQAHGVIGEAAARVVIDTVEELPDAVRVEHAGAVEALLVEQARVLDVDALRKVAVRAVATLHPDGDLEELERQQRRRHLNLTVRGNGTGRLDGELTVEATEYLRTVLDTLTQPRPHSDGERDERTGGQRRHDALLDLVKISQRAQLIPDCAGITTTVILTMTRDAYETGRGTAITGHGTRIPATEARRWAAGSDTRITGVLFNRVNAITATGSTQRLFTEGQRLALIARDQGCSFPGCDIGPQWTQAHHVIPWIEGGPTRVDNGTLLCGHHHRTFDAIGYTCRMINGQPHWSAPPWLDPTQTPRRNHAHDPVGATDRP